MTRQQAYDKAHERITLVMDESDFPELYHLEDVGDGFVLTWNNPTIKSTEYDYDV